MDRLIYTAMTGAQSSFRRQATVAHNLANVATPGFRADVNAFRAIPVLRAALPSRAFVLEQSTGAHFAPGTIQHTGRALDLAIKGEGWLVVQTSAGEGYTRNGSLEIDEAGLLKTRDGMIVQGENGPITIPENNRIDIASDGTISATDASNSAQTIEVGRLRLVNPERAQLEKGSDGLFRLRDGRPAPSDPTVRLFGGALETSNVNSVTELVNMIESQRHYERQIKLIQQASENASAVSKLLSPS